LSLISFNKKET